VGTIVPRSEYRRTSLFFSVLCLMVAANSAADAINNHVVPAVLQALATPLYAFVGWRAVRDVDIRRQDSIVLGTAVGLSVLSALLLWV
jgi:hypothetical protein